jgi:hypothetical protein
MTPEQWQQVKAVLEEALAEPPAERAAFLAQVGRDDAELAREVASLPAAHDDAGSFMATPALASAEASSVLDQLHQTSKWTGRRVGPYLLVREIGHGGMGAVYLGIRDDAATGPPLPDGRNERDELLELAAKSDRELARLGAKASQ